MGGNLKCNERKQAGKVHQATETALGKEFKNPYSTSNSAIVTTTLSACNATTEGQTSVNSTVSTVTIKSCPANGENLMDNSVTIE